MIKELRETFDKILEKLYPSDITCFLCGAELKDNKYGLCDKCEKEVKWNDKVCQKCGSPLKTEANYCIHCQNGKRTFDLARAPLIYSDKVALAVQELKYNNKKYLAKHFAKIIEIEYKSLLNRGIKIDLIMYVPLYTKRQKKRGYNQSELLSNELSKLIGISVSHNNLIRIKDTITQTNLSFKERQKNLESAFEIKDKKEVKDKNILLIDDVLTTGATADNCAKILKKAKAKGVYVLTFATTDGEK
jgi:ComF family protein